MRLIVECEDTSCVDRSCRGGEGITDPDAILAALAEVGVLEVQTSPPSVWYPTRAIRYVSSWEEEK